MSSVCRAVTEAGGVVGKGIGARLGLDVEEGDVVIDGVSGGAGIGIEGTGDA